MLDEANSFHPNIKLFRQVGTSASFLDVFIENMNGILAASVYRKDSTEPYIVPFKSDHLRHIFNNIIDGALMRAIRYSSTLFAFNEERLFIKFMLLYNGYPLRYIYTRFKKFFTNKLSPTSIIPLIVNPNDFLFVRCYILNRPAANEYQIASRIAKTIGPLKNDTIDDPLVRMRLNKVLNSDGNLIIHYTHEAQLATYNATKILIRRPSHIISSAKIIDYYIIR